VRYRYHAEAKQEYRDAIYFYGKAAERFCNSVESAIKRIQDAPTQFREIEAGIRVCRVQHFPYLIYYLLEEAEILIVALKHDRRDPDYWRDRI
jgi:plasmid stabilization system protein ParE